MGLFVSSCSPNEAMIVSGACVGGGADSMKFIVGGSSFTVPGLQRVQKMPLNTITLDLKSKGIPMRKTEDTISVSGTAQV